MINFFLFCLLLIQTSNAKECFSKEKSFKYFFINGVLNTSKSDTEISVRNINYTLDIKEKIGLLYNNSEGIISDLKETFSLVYKNKDDTKISKQIKKTLKEYYSKLSKDKINIIIAHSEGNLFAENLCLNNPDNKIIENISISPPLSDLKCNSLQTYVLFDNDHVIKQIEKVNKQFFHLSPTHKGSGAISHTLKSYLNSNSVASYLKNQIKETINESYDKNFSFTVAEVKIEKESFVESVYNDIDDKKDDLFLWSREKKAFLSLFKYSSNLIETLNHKDFINKILNTQIPASNEQDFADMIAYSLNYLNKYCISYFPKNIKNLCQKIGFSDYFLSSELISPKIIFNNKEFNNLDIDCKRAAASLKSEIPITLKVQKRIPSVFFNNKNLEVNQELDSSTKTHVKIGEIFFKEEDSKIYSEFVLTKKERDPASSFDISKCNTLLKLSSPLCKDFLKRLESKYFSK